MLDGDRLKGTGVAEVDPRGTKIIDQSLIHS